MYSLIIIARLGDYVGLNPPAWNRTTAAGTTLIDGLKYAMTFNATTTNELDQTKALNPVVAAVVSKFGDTDGSYAAFMKETDPFYPSQPWFALNAGVGNSGIHQGLIETTYGSVPAQPTRRAVEGERKWARRNMREKAGTFVDKLAP